MIGPRADWSNDAALIRFESVILHLDKRNSRGIILLLSTL